MKLKLTFATLAICLAARAQAPPQYPTQPIPHPTEQAPTTGTQQTPAVPMPGAQPIANPAPRPGLQPLAPYTPPAPGTSLNLNFTSALQLAQQYSQQILGTSYGALVAREDVVQAKAALLPTPSAFNQFIYTQPNGTPSGIFVSNDGPHVYNQWMVVHGDIYAPAKIADYRRAIAAEALARARYAIATRGLLAAVVQNYYGMLTAQRKVVYAQEGVSDAEQFLAITQKLEAGGEAAHADVVKAELQLEQRRADLANAQLDLEKARIGFGVMLFPNYGQLYTLEDDLERSAVLPPMVDVRRLATTNNPDIRAAEATVQQQRYELRSSRALLYPQLSFDYFYGINANQYALHDPEGHNLLGSVAQAQMTIPIWNWGATRSRIKQSEFRLQQAQTELSLAQRQLLANLDAFYEEAKLAHDLLDSLRRAVTLATENLRLTNLRYQAGEATALEVVDAQTTLLQARNTLADGLLRYRMALANLQTLTGVF